jgi:hypothetical protein
MRKKTLVLSFVEVKAIVKETHKKLNTIKIQVDKVQVSEYFGYFYLKRKNS